MSAIQDISLSPVLMSGAGTSMPGPAEPYTRTHQREARAGWLLTSDSWPTDEAFLGQLDGESPGDLLQLIVLKTDAQSNDEWECWECQ